MRRQERLRWDRARNAYIEPVVGTIIEIPRINWIAAAVQRIGGVKRLEDESGCVYEQIVQWMVQGYVNEPKEAVILARHSRLPLEYFPVGCDSNDV